MPKLKTNDKAYTRPGVEAAVRLSKLLPPAGLPIWAAIDAQYDAMLNTKGSQKLLDLDAKCDSLALKWKESASKSNGADVGYEDGDNHFVHCTCEDLTIVMEWKFAKGKPRPLWKLLRSNSEKAVKDASKLAFANLSAAVDADVDSALKRSLEDFSTLKGIGPASASAFLSLYRPDLCIFMDDEVIECLYPGKRTYTTKVYLDINAKCRRLASDLGGDWTPRRVGRALWTAARVSLCDDREDLTLRAPSNNVRQDEMKHQVLKNKGKERDGQETNYKKKRTKFGLDQNAAISSSYPRRSKRLKQLLP